MTTVAVPNLGAEHKRFMGLIKKASQGDSVAFAELRPVLTQHPELWRQWGDLAAHTQEAQIQIAFGKDLIAKETARQDLGRLREELMLPTDGGLERLLIERILVCYVQLAYADTTYIQNSHKFTLAQGDYYQNRIDRAHRRFLSAIRTLATVRKLAQPAIQVNIADRQINQVSVAQGS